MASSGPPAKRAEGLYGGMPEPEGPGGMAPRLLEFADELRSEGMAIGTSELLDAFAALREVSWTSQEDFREAMGATLAKSQEDRRIMDLVFDRFFFRAVEREAVRQGVNEQDRAYEGTGPDGIDLDTLRERIRQAVQAGDDAQMRDLARLAIAAFGRQGEGSGVIGVDVQRIRRTLGLRTERGPDPDPDEVPRDSLQQFERHVRRELERQQVERTQSLPPSRPLREFDRALPSNPAQDLAAVHRVVSQLKRRLATQGQERAAAGGGPRWMSGARCAPRCRPGASRWSCATGPSGRDGPSCTCCATCPPASPARRCSSCRCCTRCTTSSASCARSCSWSGSPR